MTDKRLIEAAFPLEHVSLDTVHEKNVRHGHVSTLQVWLARRPLAACRAALIVTLLPDAGARERQAVYRRMAGTVVETVEDERADGRTVARRRRATRGGILHWKRESGPGLDWFRARIRDANRGRAPRVLDPFAGGGAIPLEAMRLGCEVTAADVNPVAWFVLKCTLDYPRRLAGQTRPLQAFALRDQNFMAAFLRAQGLAGRSLQRELDDLCLGADGSLARGSGRDDALVRPPAAGAIELSPAASEERAILESLSNHVAVRGGLAPARQASLQRLGEAP